MHLLLTLKTIILYISFCAFSVLTIFKLRVNAIIFVALILYIFFVFFCFLIYVINFIFLINCYFESVCLTFILIVVCATNNELCTMLVYVFASCVSFLTLFTFFNLFGVFFLIQKLCRFVYFSRRVR